MKTFTKSVVTLFVICLTLSCDIFIDLGGELLSPSGSSSPSTTPAVARSEVCPSNAPHTKTCDAGTVVAANVCLTCHTQAMDGGLNPTPGDPKQLPQCSWCHNVPQSEADKTANPDSRDWRDMGACQGCHLYHEGKGSYFHVP